MHSIGDGDGGTAIEATFFKRLADSDPRHHFCTVMPSAQASSTHQFTVYHQFGQFAVDYNLAEWLAHYNKEFVTQRNALPLLQQSKREYVSHAFISSAAMSNAAAMLSALNQNSSMTGGVSSASESACGGGLKRQVLSPDNYFTYISLIYSFSCVC